MSEMSAMWQQPKDKSSKLINNRDVTIGQLQGATTKQQTKQPSKPRSQTEQLCKIACKLRIKFKKALYYRSFSHKGSCLRQPRWGPLMGLLCARCKNWKSFTKWDAAWTSTSNVHFKEKLCSVSHHCTEQHTVNWTILLLLYYRFPVFWCVI